jgi:ATP synthase protein I
MSQKPNPTVWGSLALMGQLGFTIAIPIALGAILGNLLDGALHTNHFILLFGLLLGLISGIYGAYRLFKRAMG